MQDPREEHMDTTRRVLRYLKRTAGQGIGYFYDQTVLYTSLGSVNQIGRLVLRLENHSQAILSCSGNPPFLGEARNRVLSPDYQLKQNIDQWPMQQVN